MLTPFTVPGTMEWTKIKALPEGAWAKTPTKAIKGKAGPQKTPQPNGRVLESILIPHT